MPWNHQGATRTVFVGRKRVYKFPHFTFSWKNFVMGMLANDQEKTFSTLEGVDGLLCPILWSLPMGLLVVMPRCEVLSRDEWLEEHDSIHESHVEVSNLVEMKANSFGWYEGRIVAIDYGAVFR